MKLYCLWRQVLFIVVCLALASTDSLAQRKKQMAVLSFDFSTVDIGIADRAYGGKQNLAVRISDKLITSLLGLGSCQVIERTQLEKILYEQNLGVSGRIDASTAAKVGRVLGVDSLIVGNVSVFDLKGLPTSTNDTMWDPSDLSAHIAVNYRVINTTTAQVELSNEVVGVSASQKKPSTATRFGKSMLGGFLSGGKNSSRDRVVVKDEQLRNVLQVAVDEAVNKIASEIDIYLANGGRVEDIKPAAPESIISGRIIDVSGPSVVIAGIKQSMVRMGDRLYVRRGKVRKDSQTNKEYKYSEKIGEVEVVEIQDEVVVGSYSGSGTPIVGDIVTNSSSGVGTSSAVTGQRTP